jgi:hypothetical protein
VSKTPTAVWQLSGFGDEIDPDPAVQAAVLLALGARHIEVRSAWGINVSELEPQHLGPQRERTVAALRGAAEVSIRDVVTRCTAVEQA